MLRIRQRSSATQNSAYPPPGISAMTDSFTTKPHVQSSPNATIVPETSTPKISLAPFGTGYFPAACKRSMRLSAAQETRMRASRGPGSGSGTFPTAKLDASPGTLCTIVFIALCVVLLSASTTKMRCTGMGRFNFAKGCSCSGCKTLLVPYMRLQTLLYLYETQYITKYFGARDRRRRH